MIADGEHVGNEDDLLRKLRDLLQEAGPGQRIPSERELAQRWGTSRTALRHRLRMLEAMGALQRRGAAGTFTHVMQPHDVAIALQTGLQASALGSAESFQFVRVGLERQAARLAAQKRRPVDIAHVENAVLRMEAADSGQEMYEADLDFHRSLFKASGDAALIFFSEAVGDLIARSVTERRARMEKLEHDRDEMCSLHRKILDAINDQDPAAAMNAMDNHFDRIDALS